MSQSESNKVNFIECNFCVLNNASPNINLVIDEEGKCNNCKEYAKIAEVTIFRPIEERKREFDLIINSIKKAGKNKKYDCILGISGGVDSSYLAYLAKQEGLRPLVVHFDNGWNSELAVKNIESIIHKLNFELFTYVINWEEFRDIQLSYLKASVVDIEVPTDQFITAVLYELAYKNGIKYILDGNNMSTEFYQGSWNWTFSKFDLVNLLNIHKKYGKIKLRKYPKIGIYERFFYNNIYGLKQVSLLNYLDYNLSDVKEILSEKLDWRDYAGKHYESIFTRFYQGFILPNKFNIDKRRVHLSTLIWSGQITRDQALMILEQPPYPLNIQLDDKQYVCKKLEITELEFDKIMNSPVVSHEIFGTENDPILIQKRKWVFRLFKIPAVLPVARLCVRFWLLIKGLFT